MFVKKEIISEYKHGAALLRLFVAYVKIEKLGPAEGKDNLWTCY
jgi:hypothetical protein